MLQKSRVKVLEEVSRHLRSSVEGQSDLRLFVVSSLNGDCETMCLKEIKKFLHEECKSVRFSNVM